MAELKFYCDSLRHLVCTPYTIENLHTMARQLGVKKCWYHAHPTHPHYDIPKRRIAEISARCTLISGRDLLRIIKGEAIEAS